MADKIIMEQIKDKPFLHCCESCGCKEYLTSKEAFKTGWDYPGVDGIYKNMHNYGFGIMAPRTCGQCGVTTTVYWKVLHKEPLSESDEAVIERIQNEPFSLLEEL